jgi:hypothetical protein
MNKRLKPSIAALLIAGVLPLTAQAVSVPLIADTHISATNAGAASAVNVNSDTNGLLRFNLNSLPPIPSTQISKATLFIYIKTVKTTGTVDASPITNNWTESAVIIGSSPTVGLSSTTSTTISATDTNTYFAVDVTNLIKDWIDFPLVNFGLALSPNALTPAALSFDSKESSTTSHPAYLEIALVGTGAIGPAGPVGATGLQGLIGLTGATGPAGPVGATGLQGLIGLTGATGPAGSVGATGLQGLIGLTGATGPAGPVGATGLQGLIGLTGATGPAGSVGATGSQGLIGLTGATGPAGPVGATGAQGPIGLTGATGPAGPVGATGLQGLIGLTGATGAQGPIGLTGATGAAGTNGTNGINGINGNTIFSGTAAPAAGVGVTGDFYIDTVANVIYGPKVALGWLAGTSLVGATGATGANGATGAAGPAGVAGTNGTNGAVGAIGPAGAAGTNGINGTNGTNGVGVPVGGTAGQVLAKIDAVDYNTQWTVPPSTGWGLTGNAGTVLGTNFIGTTDNVGLTFKVNNVKAGFVSPSDTNSSWGMLALNATASNLNNSAFGFQALGNNTTGVSNVATGYIALSLNTTGSNNVANGIAALFSNTTGNSNVATGIIALYSNTTGYNNVATGLSALYSNTTGNNNTAYGYLAGVINTTGVNNTFIGNQANAGFSFLTNATALGNGAVVPISNAVKIGDTNVTLIGGQVPFSTFSDRRLKTNIEPSQKGLDFILKLQPVTYQWKEGDTKTVQDGFIAQDVEAAAKDLGISFSGIHKPENDKDHYALAYSTFVVPLVNAVKEEDATLKQQAAEIAELKSQVERLTKLVDAMNSSPRQSHKR